MVMAVCLYIMCTIPDAPVDNIDHNGEIKLLLTPHESFVDKKEEEGNDMNEPLLLPVISISFGKPNSDVLGEECVNSPASNSEELRDICYYSSTTTTKKLDMPCTLFI